MIGAAILGVAAGFLGRALLPGKQNMGVLMTIGLGIAGSLVGFLIFTELLGIGDNEAFDLGGLPGAIIGVMLLLFGYDRFIADHVSAPSAAAPSSGSSRPGGQGRSSRAAGEPRSRESREADAARRRERRNR